uniref:Knottin scorpion toxin-like domain-containing protein n=1 Tax=Leersia perrieri TaxID=77586 RepID=A0A0D9VLQ6_9ORYZ
MAADKLQNAKYFQDTCLEVIYPGAPSCDEGECNTRCRSKYKGGVGHCIRTDCKCIYTCTIPSPAPSN